MRNITTTAYTPIPGSFSRLSRVIVLLAITASLAAPAGALASPSAAIKDCAKDSKLDKTYSQSDLAGALKQLPADVDEYTDCRDVLRRAQLGGGGGGGSHGGSSTGTASGGGTTAGGSSASTPAPNAAAALASASPQERAAIQKAFDGGQEPVQIGGQQLSASKLGVGDLAKSHGIPTPLIIVLILLGLTTAGGLAVARKTR